MASLSGLIAGMPDQFDIATKALDEIQRRSYKAAGVGLLNQSRLEKMSAVSQEIVAIRGTITDLWKIVDGIIAAGIAPPEQEIEL